MATKPIIGGQAVIEGVMMRSPKSFAIAVRKPDDTIVVRERAWLSFSEKLPFLKWPLLRGANMLIESMYNGMSALQFSAEQAMEAEDKKAGKETKSTSNASLIGMMAFSILMGIAIFKGIPHMSAYFLGEYFGQNGQSALPITSAAFHLVDGFIKMCIFIGYILAISTMGDVKRLFMYHGAEHKCVHAWEKDLALDVEEARKQSTAHPRCGTSLILLVISVSILVFAVVIPWMPRVSESNFTQSVFSLLIKVPLMLPIAGIAYEFQRAAAKNPNNMFIKAFIAPGMLMQKLTTREPTDDQLEVSLTALRKAVWRERQQVSVMVPASAPSTEGLEVFANFAEVVKKVA